MQRLTCTLFFEDMILPIYWLFKTHVNLCTVTVSRSSTSYDGRCTSSSLEPRPWDDEVCCLSNLHLADEGTGSWKRMEINVFGIER